MQVLTKRFWPQAQAEPLITMLRMVLGVIFVIGGIKLGFLGDTAALVGSYTNVDKGWMGPVFAAKIPQMLGVSVGAFLRTQGVIEIILGLLLIVGLGTRVVATIVGLMFWSFAIANPIVGEIRLSRDIALMGLCFAVALSGASAWSLDRQAWQRRFTFPQRQDGVLLVIRLSLAYTLLASAIFADGPFSNHLNNTLPVLLVFLMGLLLAVGVAPHWIMAPLFIWMLVLLPMSISAKGVFLGLDSVKRELGFLAAAAVYALLGPDRWVFPWTATVAPTTSGQVREPHSVA